MRRILLLAVVAMMALMMVIGASPTLAAGLGGSGERGNPDKGIINSGGGGGGAGAGGGGGGIHTAVRSDGSYMISGGSSVTGGGTCREGLPGRQGCTG
jgi:hypothetical protein